MYHLLELQLLFTMRQRMSLQVIGSYECFPTVRIFTQKRTLGVKRGLPLIWVTRVTVLQKEPPGQATKLTICHTPSILSYNFIAT